MRWLRRIALAIAAFALAGAVGVSMGLLAGKRPDLGVVDGRLKPVREHYWNAVSSFATSEYHRIAPLPAGSDPAATFARLKTLVERWPRARLIDARPTYLRAEFSTKVLGFVDDVEFLLDAPAGVIHVRSASRLGRKDFGVNRARVESIRARLAASDTR